jgi:hypothetical protein
MDAKETQINATLLDGETELTAMAAVDHIGKDLKHKVLKAQHGEILATHFKGNQSLNQKFIKIQSDIFSYAFASFVDP